MATKLQTSPLGYLAALAAKVDGQQPNELGQLLQPTIEVLDQYLALNLVRVATTVNPAMTTQVAVAALGPFNPGEFVRLRAIGVFANVNSADAALGKRAQFYVQQPDGGRVFVAPIAEDLPGGPWTFVQGGFSWPHPLLLPAGWSVGVQASLSAPSTAAWSINVQVLIERY